MAPSTYTAGRFPNLIGEKKVGAAEVALPARRSRDSLPLYYSDTIVREQFRYSRFALRTQIYTVFPRMLAINQLAIEGPLRREASLRQKETYALQASYRGSSNAVDLLFVWVRVIACIDLTLFLAVHAFRLFRNNCLYGIRERVSAEACVP